MALQEGTDYVHAKKQPRFDQAMLIGEVVVTKNKLFFIVMWGAWTDGGHNYQTALNSFRDVPAKDLVAHAAQAAGSIEEFEAVLGEIVASDPEKKCLALDLTQATDHAFGMLKGFAFKLPDKKIRFPFNGKLREQTKALLGVG